MSEPEKAIVEAAEAEMAANEKLQTTAAAPPAAEASEAVAATSAAAPVSEKVAPAAAGGPVWPEVSAGSPLHQLIEKLPELIKEAEYSEMYGIDISTSSEFSRNLILQKFLRANANDVNKAATQLTDALKWRKDFKPLSLPSQTFKKKSFGGLAFVSILTGVPESSNATDVACWNIYGAVTSNADTFGDLDAFTKWRVAVMEAAVAKLRLAEATEPIPSYGEGPDPYQMVQVHDYKGISFLRQDPHQKAAAKKAIEIFGAYYPETLSRKMFVNVPIVMGWMFSAMKLLLSKETVRKFTVISNGKDLVGELGSSVPAEYGGTGDDLEKAEELKME